MTPEQYMSERLDSQINWYDSKSSQNQLWYKSLRTVEIVLAASIPFMVGYIQDGHPSVTFAVGAAGALIVVISSVLALNKYQDIKTQTGALTPSYCPSPYPILHVLHQDKGSLVIT